MSNFGLLNLHDVAMLEDKFDVFIEVHEEISLVKIHEACLICPNFWKVIGANIRKNFILQNYIMY